jgi:hypothetical protein
LIRLKDALLARADEFVAALNTDFGHRSRQETLLFDVAADAGKKKPGGAAGTAGRLRRKISARKKKFKSVPRIKTA